MTPAQLARSNSEAGHQTALFCWNAIATLHGFDIAERFCETGLIDKCGQSKPIPELEWLHHTANGGSRGDNEQSRMIRGGQLKAQGVKKGVADLCLPVKRGAFSGLYIELKKPSEKPVKATSKGGVSDEQREFGAFVKSQGFGWCVCYSWEEAKETIKSYINWG